MSRITHGFGDIPWWLFALLVIISLPFKIIEFVLEHRTGVWQVTSLLLLASILVLLVLKQG